MLICPTTAVAQPPHAEPDTLPGQDNLNNKAPEAVPDDKAGAADNTPLAEPTPEPPPMDEQGDHQPEKLPEQ